MSSDPLNGWRAFDLVLHGEIEIERAPEAVWPCLGRLREWKDSVVSLERIRGEANAVGEVLRIGQRPGRETVYMLQETLAARAPRWRIQSLRAEDGVSANGYIAYTLVDMGAHTLVVCDVAAKVQVTAAAVQQAGGIHALARTANDATQAKLDADHAALKRLVEKA